MKKIIKIVIGFFCGVAMIAALLYFVNVDAYPSPEYSVDSYEQLQAVLDQAGESYHFPPKELVNTEKYGGSYTVWLKDRFHDDPAGYNIVVYASEDHQQFISVDCKSTSVFGEQIPTITPSDVYGGVEIEFAGMFASFICDGCIYCIRCDEKEQLTAIAYSIIDSADENTLR